MSQLPETHDDSLNTDGSVEEILNENGPDLEEDYEEVCQEGEYEGDEFYSSPTVEYDPGKFNWRGLSGWLSPGAYWILK